MISYSTKIPDGSTTSSVTDPDVIHHDLASFSTFGRSSEQSSIRVESGISVPVYLNEFWTSKQRAAHALHEVSYRACFKPQLPRFFIERLTEPDDLVYDPFMGRGTTLVEAKLLGRRASGCDVNPLSRIFAAPRLAPPTLGEVEQRLAEIDFTWKEGVRRELEVFYHPHTLRQLTALRRYFQHFRTGGRADRIDAWIQMVATNRLTGHSPGFFSVYTLPPNQAVSIASQHRINTKRQQSPAPRDVPGLILKKSRQLLGGTRSDAGLPFSIANRRPPVLLTQSCETTPQIANDSVDLIVTSPPFLDTVDYAQDNWLRAWFNCIDLSAVPIWHLRNLAEWTATMARVFLELRRVLRPGGWLAFEVGEIRQGRIRLEEATLSAGIAAGLQPILVLINSQNFTKTANCWGVSNNTKGTNTNRVVLFRK